MNWMWKVVLLGVVLAPASLVGAESPASLPQGLTSFGGIATSDAIYVYGGHTGESHAYSVEKQSGDFRGLAFEKPGEWKTLPSGPKCQGLALAAYQGKIYRLGGFTAVNNEGEPEQLESVAEVAVFDPKTGEWSDETPLPEPRSSFDAAVLGDRLYVIAGWELNGEAGDHRFHETAWSADLSQTPLKWEAVPAPPFERRAAAVEAHDGEIYVLGGIGQAKATRRVDIFDPQSGQWRQGPDLLGEEDIDGFGAAALGNETGLYVTSLSRIVQRLSDDGTKWVEVAKLESPRFFHQMFSHDHQLWLVGGANMVEGKLLEIEVVDLPNAKASPMENAQSK